MNTHKHTSRNSEVDIEKCVEQAGANRFNLVLMAAARSREISRQHRDSGDVQHIYPAITALLEFQNGKLDKNYIKRVK
jgi:DNA-directed RNA polymerase subunit K/omega